ncbi:hypothetical protein TWF679_006287 [Orbilia oligospora]|uniref:Uncharacterized protein n=1 Tax=Orbilia oligospora TaxID=2813651 RepID=A0A8H8VAF8_ORBOL|nr:hypothetical protein TWF679_006287 [Orbilia oligospora]
MIATIGLAGVSPVVGPVPEEEITDKIPGSVKMRPASINILKGVQYCRFSNARPDSMSDSDLSEWLIWTCFTSDADDLRKLVFSDLPSSSAG